MTWVTDSAESRRDFCNLGLDTSYWENVVRIFVCVCVCVCVCDIILFFLILF